MHEPPDKTRVVNSANVEIRSLIHKLAGFSGVLQMAKDSDSSLPIIGELQETIDAVLPDIFRAWKARNYYNIDGLETLIDTTSKLESNLGDIIIKYGLEYIPDESNSANPEAMVNDILYELYDNEIDSAISGARDRANNALSALRGEGSFRDAVKPSVSRTAPLKLFRPSDDKPDTPPLP